MNKASWDSIAESFSDEVREIARHDLDGVLAEEVARLGDREFTAADLGCGVGSLVPSLVEEFGAVHAVDFSEDLVRVARARHDGPNVNFGVYDLTAPTPPSFEADVTFSVNVLIDPREDIRRRIAETIAGTTRMGGSCVVVAQSFESVLHTYQTIVRCRESEGDSRGQGVKDVERLVDEEVTSVVDGIVDYGGLPTKCFLRDELAGLVEDVGFDVERVRRVPYPWEEEIDYAPDWLGEPYPWDWLVVATRRR